MSRRSNNSKKSGGSSSRPRDLATEADTAFKSPTQLAHSKRFQTASPTGSHASGGGGGGSVAGHSRRSASLIQSSDNPPDTAELFQKMSHANSVKVDKKSAKKLGVDVEEEEKKEDNNNGFAYPVEDFMRGVNAAALTLMQSLSLTATADPTSPASTNAKGDEDNGPDAEDLWEFATSPKSNNGGVGGGIIDTTLSDAHKTTGGGTTLSADSATSQRTPLDLHRNDNAFHVMANLLVEFIDSKLTPDGHTIVLQPEDRVRMERVLPESVRLDFIDAVRYRLSNITNANTTDDQLQSTVSPTLEKITLQCQEYGMDRDGRLNPIFVAANLRGEPSFIPVQSVLQYGSFVSENDTLTTDDDGTAAAPSNTFSFLTNPSVSDVGALSPAHSAQPLPSHLENDNEDGEEPKSPGGGGEVGNPNKRLVDTGGEQQDDTAEYVTDAVQQQYHNNVEEDKMSPTSTIHTATAAEYVYPLADEVTNLSPSSGGEPQPQQGEQQVSPNPQQEGELTDLGVEATESQYMEANSGSGSSETSLPKPDPSATLVEEDFDELDEKQIDEMIQNPMGCLSPRNQALADRLQKHRELVERIHQKKNISDIWSAESETTASQASKPAVVVAGGGPPGEIAASPSVVATSTATASPTNSKPRDRWLEKEREVEEWFQRREMEVARKAREGAGESEEVLQMTATESMVSPRNERGERTEPTKQDDDGGLVSIIAKNNTKFTEISTMDDSSLGRRDPTPRHSSKQHGPDPSVASPTSTANPTGDSLASKSSKNSQRSKKSKSSSDEEGSIVIVSQTIRTRKTPPQPEDVPAITASSLSKTRSSNSNIEPVVVTEVEGATSAASKSSSTAKEPPVPEMERNSSHRQYGLLLGDASVDHVFSSKTDEVSEYDRYKVNAEDYPSPRDEPESKSRNTISPRAATVQTASQRALMMTASPQSDVNANAALDGKVNTRSPPPGVVYLGQLEGGQPQHHHQQQQQQQQREEDNSEELPLPPNTAPAATSRYQPYPFNGTSPTPEALATTASPVAKVPAPSTTTAVESRQQYFNWWKSPTDTAIQASRKPPLPQQQPAQKQQDQQSSHPASHPTFDHKITTPTSLFTINPFAALAAVANPFAVGGGRNNGNDDVDDDHLLEHLEEQKKVIKLKAQASSSVVHSPSSEELATSRKPAVSTPRANVDPTVIAKQQLMAELREVSNLMEESKNPETAKFWQEHIFHLQNQLRVLNGEEPEIDDSEGGNVDHGDDGVGGDTSIKKQAILDSNRRLVSEIEHREKYLPREPTPLPAYAVVEKETVQPVIAPAVLATAAGNIQQQTNRTGVVPAEPTEVSPGEVPSNWAITSQSSPVQPPQYVSLGGNGATSAIVSHASSKAGQENNIEASYVPPKIQPLQTAAATSSPTKMAIPSTPDATSAKGVEEPSQRKHPVHEDLPLVDVVAPADLPGGYHFEAELEGKRFLATVPAGGVQQGETFTCYMRELDSVAIDIPVGYWKDGLSNICDYGCCHSVFWNAFFCPLVALGQVQTRVGFDFLGRPLASSGKSKDDKTAPPPNMTNRAAMLTVITSWLLMNVALYACYNWKWGRGLYLSMADMAAFAVVNVAMYLFVVFVAQSTRASLREKFMIQEKCCSDLEDICVSSFCLPFVVGQMARHTANYDDYEAVCCSKTGLPDGVRVNQRPHTDPDQYVV